MKIEQITLENYKTFKKTTIKHLPSVVVLLGLNGSGKSTFFDVFGFLRDALHNNVTIALNRRGGFKEVISRTCNPDEDCIRFEIKFRNVQNPAQTAPLITYEIKIGQQDGKACIHKEILKYRRGRHGKPWHFLDFAKGEGTAITNEEDYGKNEGTEPRTEQNVTSADILAIKGLGQFEKFKAIRAFRELLERWYVSDFKIEHGKQIGNIELANHLSTCGDNLPQVTHYIRENHAEIFEKILEKLPKRIPGLNKVTAIQTEDGRILLKFHDESFKDPFVARYVSDGTIKMFAYLILLHDPVPYPLLCLEEPENFLHPDLLSQLVEEIREYAHRGGQVFVSTHSPDFVNALEIENLFILVKEKGFSQIKSAQDQKSTKALFEAGNQLGWLWRNRYIEDANIQ